MFWFVDLILPITMIAISFYYRKKAYSDISVVSGFRVKESMTDKDAWKFAHLLASKILIKTGLILGGLIILIKLIAPLDEPFLSLINNGISIIAYIVITIYITNKCSQSK